LLPILNVLLLNWETNRSRRTLFALVISPTRELAMQIASVLKDISTKIRETLPAVRIESAAVIGGMSEDKQRRLLSTEKKPLHIVVATPGRLVEIFEDETVSAFQDLSTLRFLIVDEADRIMEEGHYAEVRNICFSECGR
jgi:ATP-dependent RNA helicase DDX24/MAK5